MFVSYGDKEFDQALLHFDGGSKLEKKIRVAEMQLQEFREKFPRQALYHMPQHLFRSPERWNDDFCHWITRRTNAIAGTLSWSLIKLCGYCNPRYAHYANVYGPTWSDDYYRKAIIGPLSRFIETHGRECLSDVEHALGQPLVLKLLVLYYPDSFINITRVGWLDRIIWAFKLAPGRNIVEKSRIVRRFYEEKSSHVRRIHPIAFVEFLDQYLGLGGWDGKEYVEYLIRGMGCPEAIALRFDRLLRGVSRYLVNCRAIKRPIIKETSEEVLEQLKRRYLEDDGFLPEVRGERDDSLFAYEAYQRFCRVRSHRGEARSRQLLKPIVERSIQVDESVDYVEELKRAEMIERLVGVLKRSGRDHPNYCHYTSLSALHSIVRNQRMRLTRGDDPNMNDQLEWQYLGDQDLWRRTYITSFSCVRDESAAMWGLYGKPANEAVRLSMPHALMEEWISRLEAGSGQVEVELNALPGMPPERINLTWNDIEVSFGDVIYGGDVSSKGRSDRYKFRGVEIFKKEFKHIKEPFDSDEKMTGYIKSIDWAYEEEARLIVKIKDSAGTMVHDLSQIKYVYLPFPQEIFCSAIYMLGPCLPEQLNDMVKKDLGSLVSGAAVLDSKYAGYLKFKP